MRRGVFASRTPARQYSVWTAAIADYNPANVLADLRRTTAATAELKLTRSPMLRGIVRDANKKPVAGANVYAAGRQAPVAYAWYSNEQQIARSGGDGAFRLRMPTLPARLFALHATHAAGITDLDANLLNGSAPVTVTVPDGLEVQGIAVDAEGKPVAGAGVLLMEDAGGAIPLPLDAALATGQIRPWVVSGADGKFQLRLNAKPHDLTVAKEGYVSFRSEFTPGDRPVRAVLTRGVAIQGRVVRKDGTLAGPATLHVRGDDGTMASAMVGEDGAFTVTSLPAGEYTLTLRSESGGMVRDRRVTAPAADVLLELDALATVRLTVTDQDSGLPIAYNINGDSTYQHVEAQAEPYLLQIPAGPVDLQIDSDGYVTARREVVADASKAIDLAVALVRGRIIHGRVVDTAGAPIAEARVESDGTNDFFVAETTSADGEFQLDGVPPGDLPLTFVADGYLRKTVEIPRVYIEALNVVLSKGRAIAGRVVNEAGQPVEGASVTAASAAHGADSQSATTAADGTFRIGGLADARHSLNAAKAGYRHAELRDLDLNTTTPIVLTLRGQGLTGTVHGSVDGFHGGSWLFGWVAVESRDDDSTSVQGQIKRDGSYRIEGAPAGEVEISATAGGARGENRSVNASATVPAGGDIEVNLSFNNGVAVRGIVRQDGKPLPGRGVSFYTPSVSGSLRTVTDSHGLYEVSGLQPGRYTVSVEMDTRSFVTTYDVTGSADTFDIEVAFARIEGRVVDSDGVAVADAEIEPVSRGDSWSNATVKSDAAGAFLSEVPPGTYDVRVTRKGFAGVTQRVETNGAPLLIRMVRSDGIRVRLVDARDGATLSGYVVATDSKNVQLGRVHEQERDGSLTVALAPGSYRISVSADGYASQTVQTAVPLASELRIPLTPGGTLIVRTDRESSDLVKLVQPNGVEYVRCHCNGIAEIRLTGKTTTVEHIAPGNYTMQVINAQGKTIARYPVVIAEGGTAVAEVRLE